MLLAMPGGTFAGMARQQVGPPAGRQIIVNHAVFGEDWSYQERASEHVLAIERVTGWIVGKFEEHGAHHGDAFARRFEGRAPEIRHEATLQFREKAEHFTCFFVVRPGNTIARAAVETAVRGKQAKGGPAFVDVSRRGALEAADVVTPEAEAAQAERQAAAQRFGHRLKSRPAVAAPVHGEPLTRSVRRAGEEYGLTATALCFNRAEDGLVVHDRIEIMHLHRIGTIVIDDTLSGDAFTK